MKVRFLLSPQVPGARHITWLAVSEEGAMPLQPMDTFFGMLGRKTVSVGGEMADALVLETRFWEFESPPTHPKGNWFSVTLYCEGTEWWTVGGVAYRTSLLTKRSQDPQVRILHYPQSFAPGDVYIPPKQFPG